MNEIIEYPTRGEGVEKFDISVKACKPFGFYHAERVL